MLFSSKRNKKADEVVNKSTDVKAKKSKKKIVWILIAVVIIAAAFLYWWFFINASDGSCDIAWGMGAKDVSVEFIRDMDASQIGDSAIYEMNRVPGMIRADTMVKLSYTENDELYQVQMMTGIGDYSGADLQKKIMKYLKKHFGEDFKEVQVNEDLTYKVWRTDNVVVAYSNGSSIFFYNPNAEHEVVEANNIKYEIVSPEEQTEE